MAVEQADLELVVAARALVEAPELHLLPLVTWGSQDCHPAVALEPGPHQPLEVLDGTPLGESVDAVQAENGQSAGSVNRPPLELPSERHVALYRLLRATARRDQAGRLVSWWPQPKLAARLGVSVGTLRRVLDDPREPGLDLGILEVLGEWRNDQPPGHPSYTTARGRVVEFADGGQPPRTPLRAPIGTPPRWPGWPG